MTSRRANRGPSRPDWLALKIIETSVLLLPAGEIRERYARELHAELVGLPQRRQLRYALGIATTSVALRRAVTGRQRAGGLAVVVKRRSPVRCAVTGHTWRKEFTEDNQSYASCRKCGKVLTDAVWVIDPAVQGGLGVR